MRNLHNIEKSGFRKGAYVGYGGGKVWRIKKTDGLRGRWSAVCLAPGSAEHLTALFADTLAEISYQLSDLDSRPRGTNSLNT